MKQTAFQKTHWRHSLSYGGTLRNQRLGRKFRPLSGREPLHLVLKANRHRLKSKSFRSYKSFFLIHQILQRYSLRFYVKIEQISVQGDHLHLLIRTSRRSNYQSFFRVFAGQIAQRLEAQGLLVTDTPKAATERACVTDTSARATKLWRYRPFTRVVRGYRAYKIVRDYIQLNEKEALREIPYQKQRLRGLRPEEWGNLWE